MTRRSKGILCDPHDRATRRNLVDTLAALAATIVVALALMPPTPARAAKPNIVLILADDLGYNDTGFNGGTQIRTPNIDALAHSGVVLTSGHSASAVCSPSRAGLMTGRYPQRFGHENNQPAGVNIGLPFGEVTVADVLRRAGYATGLIGKWHLGGAEGYRPNSRGFDFFYGFLPSASNYLGPVPLWRNAARVVENRYLTTAFGAEAVAFINRNRTRPFFLYLAFNAPHTPLQAPAAYLQRYAAIADGERRTYAAMVSALDDAVGVVAAALKRNGLDRNTLLIFTSDNGGATWVGADNRPLRGQKSDVYEGGVRVPMFVRWPAMLTGGRTFAKPVISLDVMPTAVAAAGAPLPSNLDGVNLLPYLRGVTTALPHRTLFWRLDGGTPKERSAALVHPMKLDVNYGTPAVYNLATDLGEHRDIKTPALLARLRGEYQRWETCTMGPRW